MITVTECNELPESFDSLFDQSLEYLDRETTLDWRYMGNPRDAAAKKEKVREIYQDHIDASESLVVCWEKDGVTIHIGAGSIKPKDDKYIQWNYGLFGKDATGSKSFLHEPEYVRKTAEFVRNTLGMDGYSVSCQKGGSIYDYHFSRANDFEGFERSGVTYTNPDIAPEVTLAIIRYRYLD